MDLVRSGLRARVQAQCIAGAEGICFVSSSTLSASRMRVFSVCVGAGRLMGTGRGLARLGPSHKSARDVNSSVSLMRAAGKGAHKHDRLTERLKTELQLKASGPVSEDG